MYEKRGIVFLYTISPVHVGTGQAIGVVDNPIQRERHTKHPCIAGSGIKGALRHSWNALAGCDKQAEVLAILGPEPGSQELYAGAANIGDAQLLLFPIRSLKNAYVYATCPLALARARRLCEAMNVSLGWEGEIPEVKEGHCLVGNTALLHKKEENGAEHKVLFLETFEYKAEPGGEQFIKNFASALVSKVIPESDSYKFFRKKLGGEGQAPDLVVLSDTDFTYFVENATLVETHVRINGKTGAADEGGLFYTENLPPEVLLLAPVMASRTRGGSQAFQAEEVLDALRDLLDGAILQIGGDATTGRGLVVARLVKEG